MEIAPGGSYGSHLLELLRQLTRRLRRLGSPDDLSAAALAVLHQLQRRGGVSRVTELARADAASQPATTQVVGRLERAGLVRRVPDPVDGRSMLVEVTATGHELVTRLTAHRTAALDGLLSRLDAVDRDAIARALPALTRLAELAAADTSGTESGPEAPGWLPPPGAAGSARDRASWPG